MADSKRDIELRLAATASGTEQVRKLATEIDGLAKAGGSAAPDFARLAEELRQVGQQAAASSEIGKLEATLAGTSESLASARENAARLRTEYDALQGKAAPLAESFIAARNALNATNAELAQAKAALGLYKAGATDAEKVTKEFAAGLDTAKKRIAELKVQQATQAADVKTLRTAYSEVNGELGKSETAYNRAERQVTRLSDAFAKQGDAVNQAKVAAANAGTEVLDLATATERLNKANESAINEIKVLSAFQQQYKIIVDAVAASNERAVEAARAASAARENAARVELAQQQRIAAFVGASNDKAVSQARAAADARIAAARQTAAAETAAARESEAALLKQRLAQDAAAASARAAAAAMQSAFSTVGVRSAEAIRAEIQQIDAALAKLATDAKVSGSEFDRAFTSAKTRVEALQKELRGIDPALQQNTALVGVLRQSFSQLTAAFGAFELGRQFFTANNQFETLRRTMTLITGSTQDATQQIQFLRDTANNAGLSVGALSQDFVNFSAAANTSGISLEKQREVFGAVANAAGQLGLSTDRVGLVLQALAQTANKGKVSLEELQGQLGESLPGALSIVANGFGVTKERLLDMVKAGIDVNSFFDAFIRGSRTAFGEGEARVNSFQAAFNRLKNAFDAFATRAADTGPFKLLISTIDGLATNFDKVANAATLAAEAFAFKKLASYVSNLIGLQSATERTKIAQDAQTASTVRSTEATVVNTTATQANTAAKTANAAAATSLGGAVATSTTKVAESTAKIGAFTTALGLMGSAARGVLSLIGGLPGALALVALNARDLGTWIGESAARLVGWGRALDDAEKKLQAQARAEQQAAENARKLADEQRLAEQRALGLSGESAKLVDTFNKVAKESGNTSDALAKLTKELRFDDLSGIQAAGTALNALAQTGKLTAQQIKDAYTNALKSEDLLVFETNARAAFEGAAGGAQQLKIVLEAISEESLRRIGTSLLEVQTGFSSALNSAINSTDRLRQTLSDTGATAQQTSALLTQSLGKEIDLSNTQKALDEVIARIKELGDSSTLASTQYEATLTKAIAKSIEFANTEKELRKVKDSIDEITRANPAMAIAFEGSLEKLKQKLIEVNPYLRQLSEDAKKLGVTLSDSTTSGVEAALRAYERLKLSGKLTTDQLNEAFLNVAKQATTAAGGIVPEWVKVEAAIRGVNLEAANLGPAIQQSVAVGIDGIERLGERYDRLKGKMQATEAAANKAAAAGSSGATYDKQNFATNTNGDRITAGGDTFLSVFNKLKSAGLTEREAKSVASEFTDAQGNVPFFNNGGQLKYGGENSTLDFAIAQAAGKIIKNRSDGKVNQGGGFVNGIPAGASAPAPSDAASGAASAAAPGATVAPTRVEVVINGRSTTIGVASQADATNLTTLIQQLADAANRVGS